jgi:hypothetical protein
MCDAPASQTLTIPARSDPTRSNTLLGKLLSLILVHHRLAAKGV